MRIKKVRWRDSRIYLYQISNETDWEVDIITSVGFLVHEDKKKIVLARDIIGDDLRGVIAIPKENVVN